MDAASGRGSGLGDDGRGMAALHRSCKADAAPSPRLQTRDVPHALAGVGAGPAMAHLRAQDCVFFACACWPPHRRPTFSEEAPAVISVAEEHADGRADFSAVEPRDGAAADGRGTGRGDANWKRPRREWSARRGERSRRCRAWRGATWKKWSPWRIWRPSSSSCTPAVARDKAAIDEHAAQAGLLHEIAGNPFSPARLDPAWLVWNDGVVERIARGVHDDRAYHDMPILADALLDAGCRDEAILDHCRDVVAHQRSGLLGARFAAQQGRRPPEPSPPALSLQGGRGEKETRQKGVALVFSVSSFSLLGDRPAFMCRSFQGLRRPRALVCFSPFALPSPASADCASAPSGPPHTAPAPTLDR